MSKTLTNSTVKTTNTSKGENTMTKLNTTAITNALVNLGFKDPEVITVTKNNVKMTGIRWRAEGSNVAPVVYIDDCKNETEAVERCRHLFSQPVPDFGNPFDNLDKSRIKARIYSKGNSGTDVTRDYLNLEICAVYEVIMHDGAGSIKIKSEHLRYLDMTADEILDTAIANSMKDCTVCGIQTMMAKLMGETIPPIEKDFMYVLTSNDGIGGAINILNTDAIKKLSDMYDSDLYILPSSLHEVLVCSTIGADVDYLRETVGMVNGTEVRPEDKLGDSVYIYNRKNGKVAIA